ncbi:MAG TPA: galactose oxidase, partial [Gammaproteobacteria bacterium]
MVNNKNNFGLWALPFIACLCLHAHADIVSPESWVQIPVPDDPVFENLTIPADAATKGMWSGVKSWPMNGLHAVLLPDGRVLTFGTSPNGASQDGRYYDLWDPALGFGSGAHDTIFSSSREDSFCAAAVYLPDGTMMISGGNGSDTSTIYEPVNHSSFTSAVSMAEARWYPTLLTLPDGRPIIMGGMVPYTESMANQPEQAIANGWPSMTPEIFENGQWRSLFGANSRLAFGPDYLRTSYPRAWVAPDGRVFGISADQMWYLDPNANDDLGEVISAGVFKGPYSANSPVNVGATNTAVMYAPGKILQVGGNGGFNGDELPGSDMATVIDINGGAPVLTEQTPMNYPRRYPNSVVLADGKVVITGGATYGNDYSGQPADPVFAAEIWNPGTGAWTLGA